MNSIQAPYNEHGLDRKFAEMFEIIINELPNIDSSEKGVELIKKVKCKSDKLAMFVFKKPEKFENCYL